MSVTPLELARVAAAAADEKKADDLLLLDLTGQTDVCDYFLLLSASNPRLLDAIVEEVEDKVRANCDERPLSVEGRDERTWILMDYGSVVVHAFLPETRDYYRLDKLWGDAPVVEL